MAVLSGTPLPIDDSRPTSRRLAMRWPWLTACGLSPIDIRLSIGRRIPGFPPRPSTAWWPRNLPRLFPDFVTADKDGFLSVNSSPLVFANTAAIQELHAQVASRDARIQALESRNAELQHELSRLKKSCAAVASLADRLEVLEKQLAVVPPAAGAQWAANR